MPAPGRKRNSGGGRGRKPSPRLAAGHHGDAPDRTEQPGPGRPSSYRADYVERAYKLCLLGLTDSHLALCFNVNADTLNEWKHKHPEFGEALKRGREQADQAVASSLYHRALGYSHESVKIFNNEGAPLIVPFTEHYPPDVTACIFWLKNRQRDKWTDKGQDITVNNSASVELPESFMDAVRKLASARIERGGKPNRGKG